MITYKVAETRPDKTFRGTDPERPRFCPQVIQLQKAVLMSKMRREKRPTKFRFPVMCLSAFFEVPISFQGKNVGAYALLVPEHARSPPGGLCSRCEPGWSASSGRTAPRLCALFSQGTRTVSEPQGRPRAAAGPLPPGARSCRAAYHQGSVSVLFSGDEMILSR